MASTIEKKPAATKKSATKKPAAKKAAKLTASKAKASTASKPKAVKKSPAIKASTIKPVKISAAERYRMVETAAYFIAERHDFTGNSTDYWITAEAQIKKMLAK